MARIQTGISSADHHSDKPKPVDRSRESSPGYDRGRHESPWPSQVRQHMIREASQSCRGRGLAAEARGAEKRLARDDQEKLLSLSRSETRATTENKYLIELLGSRRWRPSRPAPGPTLPIAACARSSYSMSARRDPNQSARAGDRLSEGTSTAKHKGVTLRSAATAHLADRVGSQQLGSVRPCGYALENLR